MEAPTAGSVILAGVLLKVGTFGMYKFILPVLPSACIYFSSVVFVVSVWAVFYGGLMAMTQLDMKKIIAYSSVSHMGLVTAGLFSTSTAGVVGSVYMMLSHGLVSSALFIFVGVLYERYGTRNILYYSGLALTAPILMVFGFLFFLANIGFPGTSGFVGEFLCLAGITLVDFVTCLVLCFSIIITAAYSL